MRMSLSRLAAQRDRAAPMVAYPAVVVAAWLATANLHTSAVAGKLVNKLGVMEGKPDLGLLSLVGTILKPADNAGRSEITTLIQATVALVLLGAFVFFLLAIFQTMGGRRGGVERVLTVVFALVIAVAGLEVLA
ncbi:MAG: hypothetical protein M3387_13460 [Actinomycetota bacterium]|nr:hypothetical protein [Actinomycetota bacterium]